MKTLISVVMALIGLTFIYNPYNGVGFVYMNDATDNYIIIVDSNMNVLRTYRGVLSSEKRLDTTFEEWLQDKIDKGMPFKSLISPYRNPNPQRQYEMQEKRRY